MLVNHSPVKLFSSVSQNKKFLYRKYAASESSEDHSWRCKTLGYIHVTADIRTANTVCVHGKQPGADRDVSGFTAANRK